MKNIFRCLTARGESSCSDGKLQEVFAEILPQVGLRRLIEEHSAELLARPQNLSTLRECPSGVGRRQIEELERAVKGSLEPIVLARRMCPERAVDFTAHVTELFHERQRVPSTRGKG